jgi:hypothetical protein
MIGASCAPDPAELRRDRDTRVPAPAGMAPLRPDGKALPAVAAMAARTRR